MNVHGYRSHQCGRATSQIVQLWARSDCVWQQSDRHVASVSPARGIRQTRFAILRIIMHGTRRRMHGESF